MSRHHHRAECECPACLGTITAPTPDRIPEQIAEWQRLADAATPGPWSLEDANTLDGPRVAVVGAPPRKTRLLTFGPRENWDQIDEANAGLIAAARTAVPVLLASLASTSSRARAAEAERDEWKRLFELRCEEGRKDWQLAHDPAACGHPRACWQDRNWPQSEQNYDPVTKTSDPPMDYHCLMCDLGDALRAQLTAAEADAGRLKKSLLDCRTRGVYVGESCWCRNEPASYCDDEPQCVAAKAALAGR